MSNWISQDDPPTVAGIVEGALAADSITASVYVGIAPRDAELPFATVQLVEPRQVGDPVADDCWGILHNQWQVTVWGRNHSEMLGMFEAVNDDAQWPALWERTDVGPPIVDNDDTPPSFGWPAVFRYRGMS